MWDVNRAICPGTADDRSTEPFGESCRLGVTRRIEDQWQRE